MTNNKQQTAVEYLVEQLFPKALSAEQYYHIEQAKEMDKDQHIKTWEAGLMKVDFNEYYNETYGEDDSLKINNGGHQI